MDQAGSPEGHRTTRWLPWIAGCVLLAGLISAAIIVAGGDRPGPAVVSAAGSRTGAIDVTSTVTVQLSPTSTPTTAGHGTTTLPKAAVDVLNAIAGSTTTTRPRATTTTRPPAPTTTTVPTSTTAAPTTTTTLGRFTATLVNNHPQAVVLIVNGQQFPLAPAQTLDVDLPMSTRGDLVQVRLAADANCGVGDSGEIFKAGGRYRVAVVVGQTMCSDFTTPLLDIDRV